MPPPLSWDPGVSLIAWAGAAFAPKEKLVSLLLDWFFCDIFLLSVGLRLLQDQWLVVGQEDRDVEEVEGCRGTTVRPVLSVRLITCEWVMPSWIDCTHLWIWSLPSQCPQPKQRSRATFLHEWERWIWCPWGPWATSSRQMGCMLVLWTLLNCGLLYFRICIYIYHQYPTMALHHSLQPPFFAGLVIVDMGPAASGLGDQGICLVKFQAVAAVARRCRRRCDGILNGRTGNESWAPKTFGCRPQNVNRWTLVDWGWLYMI